MITVAHTPIKTFLSQSKIPGYDYVINPYVGCPHKCVYCYAEYMRKFSGHDEPWGEFLDVRHCDTPLKPSKLFHTRVLISSVTDPYNPYECTYEVTRGLLQQLVACQAHVHILTKSALVIRDTALFKQLPECKVTFSFSSADDTLRAALEPGASSVDDKIIALHTLHAQGITTGVMVAPIMPGLTDWKAIISRTRSYTDHYSFDSLNMRPAYQRKVLNFIEKHYPHTLPLYTDIYVHENSSYWDKLADEIREYTKAEGLNAQLYFPHETKKPKL